MNDWCFRPRFCTVLGNKWATWANEMNFGINHAPGAGSTAWRLDLQS